MLDIVLRYRYAMVNLRRDMIQGLVRVRVLHAAAQGQVSGVELSQELALAGHKTSPGTLYPLLHQMEKAGWLKSHGKTVKGKRRRYYRLTRKGGTQLDEAVAVLGQFLFGIVDPAPSGEPIASSNGHTSGEEVAYLPSSEG